MTLCPICSAVAEHKYRDTPYHVCPNCDCWLQWPQPPKVLHADHEDDPAVMSDGDRAINRALAASLYHKMLGGKPGRTLDVGAALPVLASAFHDLGCNAEAIDPAPVVSDLPVKVMHGDIENLDAIRCPWNIHVFDLITCIHSFEHFYDPLKVLRLLRQMVKHDGHLFIRMPDHKVPGFERDLTPGHYTIHPFFHTVTSILECLVQTGTFELIKAEALKPGQVDLILKAISKVPRIGLGMIVRNEMRDLPRALDSAAKAYDVAYIVDTGSDDGTQTKYASEVYLEASDPEGRLIDFSKARNRYLAALNDKADWILCLDADDELLTPSAIRRASYWTQYDAYAMWIKDGGQGWATHRLWKTNKNIHFEGRCHEYPQFYGLPNTMLEDCTIRHHGEPSANQENANARNLRILMLDWTEQQTTRTAFYMANTHRDGGRWEQAFEWYMKRINMGEAYRDEWLFAHLYAARCLLHRNLHTAARVMLEGVEKKAPDWCEFTMLLANIAYDERRYEDAINIAKKCLGQPIPPTGLWREVPCYTDAPARLISWCYEKQGNLGDAVAWAYIAKEKIGVPDKDWDNRTASLQQRLSSGAPMINRGVGPSIALHRPGAIGDIIMTLNLIPALRKKHPGCRIDYYCAPSLGARDQLGQMMLGVGVDEVCNSSEWYKTWQSYDQAINLIGYPLTNGYPDKPMERHLLDYFAAEMLVDNDGEGLRLNKPEGPLKYVGDYATIQTTAGWSKYKQWPLERWKQLVPRLAFPLVHLRTESETPIPGTIAITLPLAGAINVFANAKIHLGIDSFCNHLTHYRWNGKHVPGVILWGSTQASAAGYDHNVNISRGLHCQPCFRENPAISRMARGPCINPFRPDYQDDTPHACMDGITIDEVETAAKELWSKS
jgi:glycosyltransferase involved in cell wall biosynthesis/SAM-dependent methyltransferase